MKKKMIIEICSQARALRLAEETGTTTSIISITSTEEKDVAFPGNPDIVSVMRLKINDITEEYDEEGIPYGCPVPGQEDFTGLKEFVTGLVCDRLIVHCYEGASRSAAVAKAIYEFRGCRDTMHAQQEMSPNPLVYALARRNLSR